MSTITRPTVDPIAWAESADPGDIAIPDPSLVASGFAFLETLPHNVHNHLLREGYRWSMYLDDRLARRVEDLAVISTEVDAGGLFTVDFGARSIRNPLSTACRYATMTAGGTVNRVRLTGKEVLVAFVKGTTGVETNAVCTAYDYDGAATWRYKVGTGDGLTASEWESATAVCFDATYVYVALRKTTGAGRIVRLLRSTGAYNSAGGWSDMVTLRYCNDIAVDDESVYYATEYSGATETHGFAPKASGGSAMTVIDAGFAANAVAVDGDRWFVSFDAGASPAEFVAYTKSTNTVLWSDTPGTNTLFTKVSNGKIVVGGNAVSPNFAGFYDYFGTETNVATGGVPTGIAVDDRYLYLSVSGELYIHSLETGRCEWYGADGTYGNPVEDADGLVVAHRDVDRVDLMIHHGRPRLFQRVTTPSVRSPFPWNEYQPQV